MTGTPDFQELVGDELRDEDALLLRRVHDRLVAAGPPPELSPRLAEPPATNVFGLRPRRRLEALIVLAAALAAVAFGAGYLAGNAGKPGFTAVRTVPMHGVGKGRVALASIRVGKQDAAGNWPLRVAVRGLAVVPKGSWYELYLTKKGKAAALCGYFTVHAGTTNVHMTVPYVLKQYDGWIVIRHDSGRPESMEPLLTT